MQATVSTEHLTTGKIEIPLKKYILPGALCTISYLSFVYITTIVLELIFISPITHSYHGMITPVTFMFNILLLGAVPVWFITSFVYLPLKNFLHDRLSDLQKKYVKLGINISSVFVWGLYCLFLVSFYRHFVIGEYIDRVFFTVLYVMPIFLFTASTYIQNISLKLFHLSHLKYTLIIVAISLFSSIIWEILYRSGSLLRM